MTIYQSAKMFVDNGISVFPVRWRDKRPAVPSWEVYKSRLPTDTDLRSWFPCDMRNYGVCLGWQRLAVLDFDTMQAWYDWNCYRLDSKTHPLDNAYTVKTSRGVHLYFLLLEDTHNMKLPGIDFKINGYVVGPGSTHPSGHVYRPLSAFVLPIAQSLSDVVPAEMLEQATYERDNLAPVAPVQNLELPTGDIWEQAEQAALLPGVLTPMQRAKSRYKVEGFFPGYKPDHGYLHVLCPFHADKEPSAWVDLDKQLFGCHKCNMRPLSVIGLYAALKQIDIKQAVKEMAG